MKPTDDYPVLYPEGTRIVSRDGGAGTVIEVLNTAPVWNGNAWVSVPIEPYYKVRLDIHGTATISRDCWLSKFMLSPLTEEAP